MKSSPPLWTAMITPLFSSGEVDYNSLEKLLIRQQQVGNGVLILGSTGESLGFNDEEKREILNFSLKRKERIPLMAGVGGIHLPSTLEWLEFLEGVDVDCYLMTTPAYVRPNQWGQYHWFKKLLDKASRPCLLYNVPSRTGCSLDYKTVQLLSEHPRFWGIKEASGKASDLLKYKKAAPVAKIFGGDDALFGEFSCYGIDGLISVAANVWPSSTRRYVETAMMGRLKDASGWRECCETLFTASNPIPVKGIMAYKELIADNGVRPPLSSKDLQNLAPLISADLWIKKWMKNEMERSSR